MRAQNVPRAMGGPSDVAWDALLFLPNSLEPGPDLEELLEVGLEAGRERVRRGIAVVQARGHDHVVRPEDVEVVADRLVVEAQGLRDRIRVRGLLSEEPDDLRSVDPASGPRG